MRTSRLALLGGTPVRTEPFPRYNAIGEEEKKAVLDVLDSGVLSQFLGTWGPDFYGGPRVQRLEREWADHFSAKHAVSVNSGTSGLYAAVAAAGIGPGDEVIVPPYTMSASVAGVLLYGGRPVFADIDPATYCISVAAIERALTPRTRALVTVDLFGHPADYDRIVGLARSHRLTVIEDAAQAPGAMYKGRWTGGLGDVGIFSLNYHKAIHCGEGGMVITNDDGLAERVRLARNHGEAVVKAKGDLANSGMVGFNLRMTEIEAAIASEQLRKLEMLTQPRIEAAEFLRERWQKIPGLTPPVVQAGCRHVYYVFAFQCDPAALGISRRRFVEAVRAEGVPLAEGYVEPLYLQPVYERRGFGYGRGLCPIVESMHFDRLVYTDLVHAGLGRQDLEDVALAVEKVAGAAHRLGAHPA